MLEISFITMDYGSNFRFLSINAWQDLVNIAGEQMLQQVKIKK